MFYAQLHENVVVSVSQLAGHVSRPDMIPLPAYDVTLLGKIYENGEFIEPEPAPAPEPAHVPLAVSMRQARHAMLQAGILGAVQTMIEQMPGEEGDAARIDWEFAQEVKRSWPLVINLGPALGLTEQQIDELFRYAATIPQ